jgi:threonine synthase
MNNSQSSTLFPLNPAVQGFSCLRCNHFYPTNDSVADRGTGCPICLQEGYPASLKLVYDGRPAIVNALDKGIGRYKQRLPYLAFPSLGEGSTPLIRLDSLAQELNLSALWIKNEGANPTGSFKDRLSPLVVARAKALNRQVVLAASSGNAGVSLAAYAAAAGLSCTIVSTPAMSPSWQRAIRLHGAEIKMAETSLDRWPYMREQVEQAAAYPATNYIDPPVGSNPFGLQGYKTMAYEISEQCQDQLPSIILVPTSRGDLLWALYEGFRELQAGEFGLNNVIINSPLPRLVAVEPFPRLSLVMSGADYRGQFPGKSGRMTSIGGANVTYQSWYALRETSGLAIDVSEKDALGGQEELARKGLYLESSSATILPALRQLHAAGELRTTDRVMLIATSHGYKEN